MTQKEHFTIAFFIYVILWEVFLKKYFYDEYEMKCWENILNKIFSDKE